MTGSEDDTWAAPADQAVASPFGVGAEFAGHRIEAELGRGGMGVVYRASHLALGKERALKVIAPGLSADPGFRDRFRREARLASAVEHPNLIPIHDAGEADGYLYISMRLVEGESLRDAIARGPMEPTRAVAVIEQTAAALDAAHAAGLVHRDVKPGNVLLEDGHVFLTDFGISREANSDATLTATGQILGSPDYVSPEQAERGVATPASDLYSLGAVLYAALTGEAPFPRDSDLAKLNAHGNSERPRPSAAAPWLPPAADDLIAKAMAIDPAERFVSGAQLATAARSALAGAEGPPRTMHTASRSRGFAVGAAALAAAGAVAAVLFAAEGDDGSDAPDTPAATESSGSVAATIDVGAEPNGVAVGEGGIWASSRAEGAVYEIDPNTDRAEQLTNGIDDAISLGIGFGSLWVVSRGGGAVVRIDPEEPQRHTTIPTGEGPSDVAVDDNWVWVTNESADTVTRIDPQTNEVDRTIPVGDGPRAVATGGGFVWVANIEAGSVSRIDPAAADTVGRPADIGERPNDLAFGEGAVWVVDVFAGTLTRLDPKSGRIEGEPTRTLAKPRSVKTGFGSVWVTSDPGRVGRIDPATQEAAGDPIPVGPEPGDLAIGSGSVWTSNLGDGTVTRIAPGQ